MKYSVIIQLNIPHPFIRIKCFEASDLKSLIQVIDGYATEYLKQYPTPKNALHTHNYEVLSITKI